MLLQFNRRLTNDARFEEREEERLKFFCQTHEKSLRMYESFGPYQRNDIF